MQLIDVVEHASARLQSAGVSFGHGTTNAFDEAAWLTLWRLGLPLDSLDQQAQRRLSAEEQAQVESLVGQRISSRLPAAYLTGEAWLQGVPFTVDSRAIVPRSLIAEALAQGSFDPWLGEHTHRVLDLCTGNGSLAVLAAMAWPDVQIVAADLSADALAVARINVERHALTSRIRLLQGDGLQAVAGQHYDLILCNPPYVNSQSMAELPPEFRAEPRLALDGGPDGMTFIRDLLERLPQHMTDEAVLILEIGHERDHFEHAFGGLEVVWLSTSAGDDQVLLVTRAALLSAAA